MKAILDGVFLGGSVTKKGSYLIQVYDSDANSVIRIVSKSSPINIPNGQNVKLVLTGAIPLDHSFLYADNVGVEK